MSSGSRASPCVRRCAARAPVARRFGLVAPSRVGLPWLLAMARQADSTCTFAHRYLLESASGPTISPAASAAESIICGNWPAAPPSRNRCATSLPPISRPIIRKRTQRSRNARLQYPTRPDHRRLSVEPTAAAVHRSTARSAPVGGRYRAGGIARLERAGLLYRLADSEHREPRAFAIEQLLHGRKFDGTGPAGRMAVAGTGVSVGRKPSQDHRRTALTLIRRHQKQLGDPARLAG